MADVEVVGSEAEDQPAGPPEPGAGGEASGAEVGGEAAGGEVRRSSAGVDPVGAEVDPVGADPDPQAPASPPLPPEGAVLLRDAEASSSEQRSARRTAPRGPRRARLHAVKILYQADLRGLTPEEALGRLESDPRGLGLLDDRDQNDGGGATASGAAAVGGARRRRRDEGGSPLDELARRLVLGVHGHRAQIDALISRHARRWAISRMPVIDRSLLRLATFELLDGQLPAAVVINEAVDLAKSLSTDDSGRFVNGVLDAVNRDLAQHPHAGQEHAALQEPPAVQDPPDQTAGAQGQPPPSA